MGHAGDWRISERDQTESGPVACACEGWRALRAISREMHSGFSALRSALPMNIKGKFPSYKIWMRAQVNFDHIFSILKRCLNTYDGPHLFGAAPCVAAAMYAPVVTSFMTCYVKLDKISADDYKRMMALPAMVEWIAAAAREHEEIDELDAAF